MKGYLNYECVGSGGVHFADKGAQAKATRTARCIDSNGVQDRIPIGTDHGGLKLQQFVLPYNAFHALLPCLVVFLQVCHCAKRLDMLQVTT